MIAWRRRNDGFEWHKHVRTTIRLKRADRRRRIDGARLAAADGLKGAGRVSVEVGSSGLSLAGKWARAAIDALQAGFVRLIEAIPPAWSRVRAMTRDGLTVAWRLAVAASGRAVAWISARRTALPSLPRIAVPSLPSLPSVDGARLASTVVAVLIAASTVLGGAWLLWWGATRLASASGLFAQTIEGRAVATTGDVLRIGDTKIRLAGIEAPDLSQICSRPGDRRWRCGAAAQVALARAVRGAAVSCTLSGSDASGRSLGTCSVKSEDIAEGLVREGHVFAEPGLFSRYASQEEEARAEKAGLWRGEAERPAEYRAKVAERMAHAWEKAKQTAPGGCPIKGRIASGRRYYVLPGTVDYHRIRIRTRRGERWFCSEEEAVAAGWKRAPRS